MTSCQLRKRKRRPEEKTVLSNLRFLPLSIAKNEDTTREKCYGQVQATNVGEKTKQKTITNHLFIIAATQVFVVVVLPISLCAVSEWRPGFTPNLILQTPTTKRDTPEHASGKNLRNWLVMINSKRIKLAGNVDQKLGCNESQIPGQCKKSNGEKVWWVCLWECLLVARLQLWNDEVGIARPTLLLPKIQHVMRVVLCDDWWKQGTAWSHEVLSSSRSTLVATTSTRYG